MPAAKKSLPRKNPATEKASVSPARRSSENPLVFISHDSRDADLAEAFGNLLTDASGGILKSFRSSDRKGTSGIEYGQEWYRAIMQKLDDATDVVALLTAQSLNRPWILYEAGVAKGKLYAAQSVLGLALGVTLDQAATGPFAQFQNSPDEEDAITSLVLQLIRRNPQADPRDEAVRRQVKAFRETVATLLQKRESERVRHPARAEENSVAKLFEEMKVLVRSVPERVVSELGPVHTKSSNRRRFHPMMFEEIFNHAAITNSPHDMSLQVLILFSTVREDFPWLYEIGLQLYKALELQNSLAIERARRSLKRTLKLVRSEPLFREITGNSESEEALYLLFETIPSLDRFLAQYLRRAKESSFKMKT
jgi:hypothetical protein